MSRSNRSRGRWQEKTRYRPTSETGATNPKARRKTSRHLAERFLRFVGDSRHDQSDELIGVVALAYRATKKRSHVKDIDRIVLEHHLRWLEYYLPVPRRFSPYREGFRRRASGSSLREPIAISWIKPSANRHLDCIRTIAEVLLRQGCRIYALETSRPGYVVHEDEFQVVAVPFKDSTWTTEELTS